jgi:predicted nucleic acid-binding Zn ribbon protein
MVVQARGGHSRKLTATSGFQVSLEASKDYLAHKKFTKASNLRYRGEVQRSTFARGPDGWVQWRIQFTPGTGDDASPVEKELNRLHNQSKLDDDEYTRLRRLYGLGDATTRNPSILAHTPPLSSEFCAKCGSPIRPGKKFCEKCGAAAPAEAPPPPSSLCAKCGAQLKPGKKFCEKCGAPVASAQPAAPTCPSCGSTVPAGKKFCTKCGARMP